MNYLDVYWARANHLGETTGERIKNSNVRSFEKWLNESPYTLTNLSVERGLYFSGIVIRSKDKEYEKIMFLHVANDMPLKVGDIMNWPLEDGNIEKWILIQEEKKVNGAYRTFWIVRCNYLLKWINKEGHLQQSWAYFVSSLDSKIKGNFRTWNNLITGQPNKYAEILMPRYPVDRATNFIVEEESWAVIEYDHTSVPGIVYLSLTENKINLIYDDVDNNVADTDKLATYQIVAPNEVQCFKIGDEIKPIFTLNKNGMPTDLATKIISSNKQVAKLVDNKLVAVGVGTVELTIQLVDFPQITTSLMVEVSDIEQEVLAYIEGKDAIRLDRQAIYELKSNKEIDGEVTFSLNDSSIASIIEQNNAVCTVKANAKNKLGQIILSAQYNGQQYTKEINIVPLW